MPITISLLYGLTVWFTYLTYLVATGVALVPALLGAVLVSCAEYREKPP